MSKNDYVDDVIDQDLLNDLVQVNVIVNVDVDDGDDDAHLNEVQRVNVVATSVDGVAVGGVDHIDTPESDAEVLLEIIVDNGNE